MWRAKGTYWFKSGSYTLFERLSLQLFRFGGFYLLVRAFTREEFGVWVLFLIINAFVEMARVGLIQNALLRYLAPARPEQFGLINTASLALNVALTLLSVAFLLLLAEVYPVFWDMPLLENMLRLYAITTVVLIPFFQFNFIQQANQDFRGIFYSNFAREGLFFCYVLYGYFAPVRALDLVDLAAFQIVAALAGAGLSFWLARRYSVFAPRLNPVWFGRLLTYGKYAVGTNTSSMLIKSLDQLMLGSLLGPAAVAVYGTAVKVANLVEIPTQAMAAVVFPVSARRIRTEGKPAVKLLYEKSVGAILALILPGLALIWFLPAWTLRFIAGEAYLEAAPILQVTLLYALFVPFARQFGTIMDSIGRPRINFLFVFCSALLNAGFNYMLILSYGTIGAAYGTLITYSMLFVANQIVLYRELRVSTLQVFRYLFRFYGRAFFLLIARPRQGWERLNSDAAAQPSGERPVPEQEP